MASGEMDGSEKEAVFGNTKFKLDYLTKPSFLHDIGLGILDRIDAASGVQLSDENFVMAYPHFNVGGKSPPCMRLLDFESQPHA